MVNNESSNQVYEKGGVPPDEAAAIEAISPIQIKVSPALIVEMVLGTPMLTSNESTHPLTSVVITVLNPLHRLNAVGPAVPDNHE